MSQKTEIIELVKAINDCWVEGRYDELHRYFHEEMSLAMPGFEERIHGAVSIIATYRDFGTKGHIHAFEPQEPHVDLLEPASAIATTTFAIDYDFNGTRSREIGTDLLAFTKMEGQWLVWWRALIVVPSVVV